MCVIGFAVESQPVSTFALTHTCADLSSSCELCRAKGCAWCTSTSRCIPDAIGNCDQTGHIGVTSGTWNCPDEDQAQQRLARKPGALSECLLMGRVAGFQTGTIARAAARITTGGWLQLRRGNEPWALLWCRVTPGKKPKYRPQLRCLPRPPSFSSNNTSHSFSADIPGDITHVNDNFGVYQGPEIVIKLHHCHRLGVSKMRPPIGKKSMQLSCRSNVLVAAMQRESQRRWFRILTMTITAQLCSKGLKTKQQHTGQEQIHHANDRAMAQLTAAVSRQALCTYLYPVQLLVVCEQIRSNLHALF